MILFAFTCKKDEIKPLHTKTSFRLSFIENTIVLSKSLTVSILLT
ncbi:hypothetical protein HMPREF9554_00171 [Treponema phagedenis F0421]|nr:hypothetical protein HMPREF9554_00171 [Treponema phagedenis F0421]